MLRASIAHWFCETSSMAALLLQGRVVVPLQLVARVPAGLLFWPLIQLAGAATDNIALGVSVGSEGRGNLPADSAAFEEVDGEDFFRQLLDDTDARVAYYSSAFLLKARIFAY
ncbi:Cytoplasmic dynein 2 heavy chain 1 [Bienertia sinuspersici]